MSFYVNCRLLSRIICIRLPFLIFSTPFFPGMFSRVPTLRIDPEVASLNSNFSVGVSTVPYTHSVIRFTDIPVPVPQQIVHKLINFLACLWSYE